MLVTIYNANNQQDQLKTLTGLDEILDYIDDIQNKNITFGSDFNVTFDYFSEVQGEKTRKKISNNNSNKGKFNLVDI